MAFIQSGNDGKLTSVGPASCRSSGPSTASEGTLLESAGNEIWLKRETGDGYVAVRVDATTGEEVRTYQPDDTPGVDELALG